MAATTLFGLQHVLRLAAHRVLSSWFGYTALEPTAIRQIAFSPVLLPVWMVDVVVKGKALLSDVQVDLDGELLDYFKASSSLPKHPQLWPFRC